MRFVDFVYFGDQTRVFLPTTIDDEVQAPLPYAAATASEVSYRWDADFAPFGLFVTSALGLPGAPIMTRSEVLQPDDIRLYKRWLTIGSGDVESMREIADNAQLVNINGQAKQHVLITDNEGAALTTVQLNQDGTGLVKLVEGSYRIRNWSSTSDNIDQSFAVDAETVEVTIEQSAPVSLLTIELSGPTANPPMVWSDLEVQRTR